MKIFVCNLSDTKENLDSLTAVLKKGLLIYEEDTKKVKITDGIHQYKDLGYIMQLDSSFVTDLNAIKTINGNIEYKTIYDTNQQPITASTLKLQTFSTNSTNNTISIDTSNFVTRNDLNYRFDNFYYPIDIYQGATSTKSGIAGLVPEATSLQKDYVLQGNGHWSNINNLISAISNLDLSFNEDTKTLSINITSNTGDTNSKNISLQYYNNKINDVDTKVTNLANTIDGKLFTDEYREKLENIDLDLYVSKAELPNSINNVSSEFTCTDNNINFKISTTYLDNTFVEQNVDMSSLIELIDTKINNDKINSPVVLDISAESLIDEKEYGSEQPTNINSISIQYVNRAMYNEFLNQINNTNITPSGPRHLLSNTTNEEDETPKILYSIDLSPHSNIISNDCALTEQPYAIIITVSPTSEYTFYGHALYEDLIDHPDYKIILKQIPYYEYQIHIPIDLIITTTLTNIDISEVQETTPGLEPGGPLRNNTREIVPNIGLRQSFSLQSVQYTSYSKLNISVDYTNNTNKIIEVTLPSYKDDLNALSMYVDEEINYIYNNLSYRVFTGATSSTSGKNGLVPKPYAGYQDRYLRGDGTWSSIDFSVVPQITSSNLSFIYKQDAPVYEADPSSNSLGVSITNINFNYNRSATSISDSGVFTTLVTFPNINQSIMNGCIYETNFNTTIYSDVYTPINLEKVFRLSYTFNYSSIRGTLYGFNFKLQEGQNTIEYVDTYGSIKFIKIDINIEPHASGSNSYDISGTVYFYTPIAYDKYLDYIENNNTLKLTLTKSNNTTLETKVNLSELVNDIDSKINKNNDISELVYNENIISIDGNCSYYYANITKETEFVFPEIEENKVKSFTLFIDNANGYSMIFPESVNNIRSAMTTNLDEQTEYVLKFMGINTNSRTRWYVTI